MGVKNGRWRFDVRKKEIQDWMQAAIESGAYKQNSMYFGYAVSTFLTLFYDISLKK